MYLFWLLCVTLVLGGLFVRREVSAALTGLMLLLTGARVRIRRPRRSVVPQRCVTSPSRANRLPPPRVQTRPGTGMRPGGGAAG
jgi:hypothetical protein